MTEKIKKEINDYIKKYAIKHNVSKEEAKEHAIVKITEKYFKERKHD